MVFGLRGRFDQHRDADPPRQPTQGIQRQAQGPNRDGSGQHQEDPSQGVSLIDSLSIIDPSQGVSLIDSLIIIDPSQSVSLIDFA